MQAPAQAQSQCLYNQAELDALLAPIALYPDSLLSQILTAATYPEQVAEAARWSWTRDLGEAFLVQEPHVMETIQQLRRRAQASGNLRSMDRQQVYQQGEAIVVQPVEPQVVYVPYYNPAIVYGPWWWPAHPPIHWKPWVPHVVVISTGLGHQPIHQPRQQHRSLNLRSHR